MKKLSNWLVQCFSKNTLDCLYNIKSQYVFFIILPNFITVVIGLPANKSVCHDRERSLHNFGSNFVRQRRTKPCVRLFFWRSSLAKRQLLVDYFFIPSKAFEHAIVFTLDFFPDLASSNCLMLCWPRIVMHNIS